MCNLYSITKGQQAIRDLAGAMRDLTGNLPMLPGVFPDYSAPIVRTAVDGVRELTMARWGMPSPIFALKGRKSDGGVTNIRNVASPHWRRAQGLLGGEGGFGGCNWEPACEGTKLPPRCISRHVSNST
jgi:putative SOS response-associated peptidase YedK